MKSLLLAGLVALSVAAVRAADPLDLPSEVAVLNSTGEVAASPDHAVWAPVHAGAVLKEGMWLRTGADSSADLLLQYNGSVFRLTHDSELRVERLIKRDTGMGMVTETRLNVQKGIIVGAQRKLHKPSVLSISTPNGEATIRGTEYVVNASGAVSVLSGTVTVTYNLPGNKGSVKVDVAAGYTFDPKTQTVVPTNGSYLQNIIADINTVQQNAETFKIAGATVVVKPEQHLSPTTPHGNNGVGNGVDPQPHGNPPINDGPGTGPGNPGNRNK
jgi:hypothetical protein